MVLSSDILTRWPALSSLLTFIVVTIFGFVYVTCNSSLVWILWPVWSFIGPYIFRNISCFHVLRDNLICSVFAHVSQPYSSIGWSL